jgi:hypothetical protein
MKRLASVFEIGAVLLLVLGLTPIRANADAVVASDGAISTTENAPLFFSVLNLITTATDPITSVSVLRQAFDGFVTLIGLGEFSYTPNRDYFGGDSFLYEATDSAGDTGFAVIDITVHEVNLPPNVSDGTVDTTENTPVPFDLALFASSTNNVPVTSYIIGTPLDGTIEGFDPSTGFGVYVPNTGFTGLDNVPYDAKAANGLEAQASLFFGVGAPSTSAPEPSTLSLLSFGLLGIAGASWYRKRCN